MKTSVQTTNGKAFEYALLREFFAKLSIVTGVEIVKNTSYSVAEKCFYSLMEQERDLHRLHASFAINFLLDLEPRLSHGINDTDILELEIVADKTGQVGDVRDVLAIRSRQKWEIGISAKNNHRAVKHSRLSGDIDFGKKWLDLPCSDIYFSSVSPIFERLAQIRRESTATQKWSTLENYHSTVYLPILQSFRTELLRLNRDNPKLVPVRLVHYLVGNQDYYKIIKGRSRVEIQAYNLRGTLNLPHAQIKPKAKIPRLKLPNKLLDISFKENSLATLLVTLNEGWQISFRIHNASSRVEPSLKFDINLVSSPHTLFTNMLFVK